MSYVVEYYGAKWCKVCVDIKPAMKQLSTDFGIEFIEYDIDDLEGDERVANIQKIPTVRVYKEKELVDTVVTKHLDGVKAILSKVKTVILTEDF